MGRPARSLPMALKCFIGRRKFVFKSDPTPHIIPNDLEEISYVDEVGTDHPPVVNYTEHEEYLTNSDICVFKYIVQRNANHPPLERVIVSANGPGSSWLPENEPWIFHKSTLQRRLRQF